MRACLQSICFILLLLVLFLFASAGTVGSVSSLALPAAVEPNESAGQLVVGPTSRELLSSSKESKDNYNLVLGIDQNGTISAINPASWETYWVLHTPPLSNAEQALSYAENGGSFLFPGIGGSLYQSSKALGARKLNMSIEDLVHRTPFIDGTILTIGSKTSTVTLVDYHTGERLHEYHYPNALPAVSLSDVKEKLVSPDSGYHRSIVTIIRDDFYLNSSDRGKFLWSVYDARVSAYVSMYDLQLNSETSSMLPLLPSRISLDMEHLGASSDILPLFSSTPSLNFEKLVGPHVGLDQHSRLLENNAASWNVNELLNLHERPETSILQSRNAPSSSFGKLLRNLNGKQRDGQFLLPNNLYRGLKDGFIGHVMEPMRQSKDIAVYTPKQKVLFGSVYMILACFAVSLLLLSLAFSVYSRLRTAAKREKQLNDLRVKENVASKKRKARKGGNVKGSPNNSNYGESSSGKVIANANVDKGSKTDNIDLLDKFIGRSVLGDGRWVGRLFVTNTEIGKGSNGTVVFEGVYDGRPVAVKRLLRAHNDVAYKEIQNLIASDRHPNIVRWYGVEQDLDFVYISLERCICSLSDLIQICSDSSRSPVTSESSTPSGVDDLRVCADFVKCYHENLELWRPDGSPSFQLITLMRDVVSGLAHLHELGIIHRDLKPQNVLIGDGKVLSAKLSDMGISKRLLQDMSSISHPATGHGSSGWQAPEQLLHGRQTRAVDLFSLGCILFYCITKGKHPFGNYYERDANIINNRLDLFLVDYIPEAVHLLSQLFNAKPEMRPSARDVLQHPLFWSSETRLSFLRDVSDRIELEDREKGSVLLNELQNVATVAFGGKWGGKLDPALVTDMGRYRKYNFESVRDLLRVIRNKLNHYRELSRELQEILGPVPEGFDSYFKSRFPNLLIEVYKVMHTYCWEEDWFRKYLMS